MNFGGQSRTDGGPPGGLVYDATEAIELGEPGAAAALINLKPSRNEQFRDEAGCELVMELATSCDEVALKYVPECNAAASYDRGVASYELLNAGHAGWIAAILTSLESFTAGRLEPVVVRREPQILPRLLPVTPTR
jgi:hypothetical protein